jgi:hypothetical protein
MAQKPSRKAWAVFLSAAVLTGIGVSLALGASEPGSTAPTSTTSEVQSYSAGDFIKSLEDTDIQAPAEIRDGGVWATGETVATTEAGADALGVPWPVATD